MNKCAKRPGGRSWRRGSMLVMACLMLLIFLAMVALSLDVAFLHLTRTELRKAADAAARAASAELAKTQDLDAARQAAKDVAAAHLVNGTSLALADEQIVFGRTSYDSGAWSFTENPAAPNAIRVNAFVPGGVSSLFGGLFGVTHFNPAQAATAGAETRDICLVLDRSGSMAWDLSGVSSSYPAGRDECTPPDPYLSRWGALQHAVDLFMNEADQTAQLELVGAVTYSSDYTACSNTVTSATVESYLTSDLLAVLNSVRQIGDAPVIGATNVSAGIDLGVQVLTDETRTRRFADKLMVLLTDGKRDDGRDCRDAAEDARLVGVTIHTITFTDNADQKQMEEVADITGGEHLHAADEAALRQAFLRIARGIPSVLTD